MEKNLGFAPLPPTKKAGAKAALIGIREPACNILSDCFRQFGIDTTVMAGDAGDRLRKEKFEACVVDLTGQPEEVLQAARTSPSNNRMVIYGLGGSAQDALQYSRFGINAVFHNPIERPSALKLVRATQMLVLHEFRRYLRIPVITEVSVAVSDSRRFSATSQELSSGGMSLRSSEEVNVGQSLELSFALLTLPRVYVRGIVSWRKLKSFGVRFDMQDERRVRVKKWVDSYLES